MLKIFLAVMAYLLLIPSLWPQFIDPLKDTVIKRFIPPAGYERTVSEKDSFAEYLRNLTLKKYGAPVLLYNGKEKKKNVHVSVFDIPLLKKDLIQCADAIMKLKVEYLYQQKKYDKIVFSLYNGMKTPFSQFARGRRVEVDGNETDWFTGQFKTGYGRQVFEEYLEFIYIYAGTISLSKEMKKIKIKDIQVGDVFIKGGSPGHAVIVVDLALNKESGKKVMLLAQSYMPSQEIHVLKSGESISPWYSVKDEDLVTPEWTFKKGSLKRLLF